jgi:hypothetical protein
MMPSATGANRIRKDREESAEFSWFMMNAEIRVINKNRLNQETSWIAGR